MSAVVTDEGRAAAHVAWGACRVFAPLGGHSAGCDRLSQAIADARARERAAVEAEWIEKLQEGVKKP